MGWAGATSNECKIDIHSQAPLQPRGALIRVFIQSSICRAKQACRQRKQCAHTQTRRALFIPLMSIQSVMALFYIRVCYPFRAGTGVCCTICLAAIAHQMYGGKKFTCVCPLGNKDIFRIGALLNCKTTDSGSILYVLRFLKIQFTYIKMRSKDMTRAIC